jgi:hypothetical protein
MDTADHAPPSSTRSSARLSPRLARACAALLAVALTMIAGANVSARPGIPQRLRTADAGIVSALARGRDRSPTFRALLERLDQSNLIVYLRRGSFTGSTAAATQLVAVSGGYRFLHVTLEPNPAADTGVALLGHELRHAVELADAPWVVDPATLQTLYRSIGFSTCEGLRRCYDTHAAVDAGRQVFAELRGRSRPPALLPAGAPGIAWPAVVGETVGGLDALGLPAALGEEPGAHEREGGERKAYGDERARRPEASGMGQHPRQRNLEEPETEQVY